MATDSTFVAGSELSSVIECTYGLFKNQEMFEDRLRFTLQTAEREMLPN